MQSASNLKVTERAMGLATETYRITSSFPATERFGLTPQIRRAAVSVGSNIAEACGRRTDREFCAFLHIALGSASELEFQLELARRLDFLAAESHVTLIELTREVKRMLARLIVAVRAREPRRKGA